MLLPNDYRFRNKLSFFFSKRSTFIAVCVNVVVYYAMGVVEEGKSLIEHINDPSFLYQVFYCPAIFAYSQFFLSTGSTRNTIPPVRCDDR